MRINAVDEMPEDDSIDSSYDSKIELIDENFSLEKVLICKNCDNDFLFPKRKGRYPNFCSEICREKDLIKRRDTEQKKIDESFKLTDEENQSLVLKINGDGPIICKRKGCNKPILECWGTH